MTEYIPITPDGIETDDTGRVLDLSLRIWVDKSRYLVPLHIYKDRGVLTLEGWYPLARCYIKVEKQEPRKPLEVWIPVHSDFGFRIDKRFYQNVTECCESAKDCNPRLFREVLPPEIKELPDSDGVWWDEHDRVPVLIRIKSGEVQYKHGECWFECSYGKWIKIEKPDFGGSDE